MFVKYMHLERYGNDEVDGIEQGTTYVFPKLDGTNAQVWLNEDGTIGAGSRNRTLSIHNDNAGFMNWVVTQDNIFHFLMNHPTITLYGEWLVPHSLKTYRDDAWRKFYIFDAFDRDSETFLDYETMKVLLDRYGLDYLAPIAIIRNGTREHFERCLKNNVFLIKDGMGVGEGIVIKNYGWTNKYGRSTFAKIVTNEFKEIHHREMGAPEIGGQTLEEKIVDQYVSLTLVDKTEAKIINEKATNEIFLDKRDIPRLLQTVWHDLITEELWDILKKNKNPKIDFAYLNRLTITKIKELRKDLF